MGIFSSVTPAYTTDHRIWKLDNGPSSSMNFTWFHHDFWIFTCSPWHHSLPWRPMVRLSPFAAAVMALVTWRESFCGNSRSCGFWQHQSMAGKFRYKMEPCSWENMGKYGNMFELSGVVFHQTMDVHRFWMDFDVLKPWKPTKIYDFLKTHQQESFFCWESMKVPRWSNNVHQVQHV